MAHSANKADNRCPNPLCPIDQGVFTLRGLFRHLDNSNICRPFIKSSYKSTRTTVSRIPAQEDLPLPNAAHPPGVTGVTEIPLPHDDPSEIDDDVHFPLSQEEDAFSDEDNDVHFPHAQPPLDFADLLENYTPSNVMRPGFMQMQEGNLSHFPKPPPQINVDVLVDFPEDDSVDNSGTDDDVDCPEDDSITHHTDSDSSMIQIVENIPLVFADHGDPDDEESVDDSSEDSNASGDTLCSSDSIEFVDTQHSEDVVVLESDEDDEVQRLVHDQHTTPGEEIHASNGSCLRPRPPKTFDYNDNQDGLYTPRLWIQQWVDWSQDVSNRQSKDNEEDRSDLPDDLSLLQRLLSDPNYLPGWHYISESQRAEISLMNSLNRIKGCPLYVYDTVLEWARSTLSTPITSMEYDSPLPLIRSRENFLKTAPTFAHTQNMKPVTKTIKLPGCSKQVSLTTTSYSANLYNFLTNPDLVNDSTLIVPGGTPHDDQPTNRSSNYDDIDSGSRYQDSFDFMKREDIDFPYGDIFFVDKSHLDVAGRLCAEPVNHTFTLVNRETRYKSEAWYSMGFIPDNSSHNYQSGETNKIRDYHFVLNEIFSDYHRLQTEFNGILWPLLYKGILYMIRLRPYVLACLGDTPGQNLMCGKIGSHKCQRICRYCEIEKKYLSHPWVTAPLMTKDRYREIQSDEGLRKSHSYKLVDIVWDKLWFGVPQESIHTNVPGELLHQFQKGLLLYILEVLTKMQCQAVAAMREEYERLVRIQNNEKGALKEMAVEQTKSEAVFGGITGQKVDNLSRALGVLLTHQSEHNLPRTHFSQGVVNSSKTTASEQQGIALLFNIILCSTWAVEEQGLALRIGLEKTGDFIKIIERLLCLEELLKCHSGKSDVLITKQNLPQIVLYAQVLLTEIREKTGRTEGEGFNTVKFHLMTHMLHTGVPMYGSPANISGGPGESQFKNNLKNPGETTQQNDATFAEQVSIRRHQHHTAERSALRVARRENRGTQGLFDAKPYLLNPLHEGALTNLEQQVPDHFGSVLRTTDTFINAASKKALPNTSCIANGLSGKHYVFFESNTKAGNGNKPFTDVAFCGKHKSSRFKLFAKTLPEPDGSHLFDLNNDKVGTKGCPGLRRYNAGFTCIADFLQGIFVAGGYSKRIPMYTLFRVKPTQFQERCTLYRADPCCYVGFKERYDWALFQTKQGLRAGQIISFIRLDIEMINIYNVHKGALRGNLDKEPGDYAMVQLLSKEIPGLLDPSFHKHAARDVMQANSTLCFYGKKQLTGRGKPLTRLLPVYKILRPLVVFPDLHPSFSSSKTGCKIMDININDSRQHSFTILRPRDLWHQVFIHQALRFHEGLGINGEQGYRKEAEKEAMGKAAREHDIYVAKEKASLEKRRLNSKLKKDVKDAQDKLKADSNPKSAVHKGITHTQSRKTKAKSTTSRNAAAPKTITAVKASTSAARKSKPTSRSTRASKRGAKGT